MSKTKDFVVWKRLSEQKTYISFSSQATHDNEQDMGELSLLRTTTHFF